MQRYDKLAAAVKGIEKRRKEVEEKVEFLKGLETEDSRHESDLRSQIEGLEEERLLDKIALLRMRQRDIYEERSALDKAVRQHEVFLEAVQLENDARGHRREDLRRMVLDQTEYLKNELTEERLVDQTPLPSPHSALIQRW